MDSGFIKHSGHLYTVKNQNGFNKALYDYFEIEEPSNGGYTKKEVRGMVQNFPTSYPTTINIVDQSFECNRVYVEVIPCSKLSLMLEKIIKLWQ